jgi:hypothetical protein
MARRRETLIERGDAIHQADGRIAYRRNLIATLQEREVARTGAALAQERAKPFQTAADGETVAGTFTGTVQLSSGKFAIVEKSHEFTLVPWRPVIDRQLGQRWRASFRVALEVWQLGRQRDWGSWCSVRDSSGHARYPLRAP